MTHYVEVEVEDAGTEDETLRVGSFTCDAPEGSLCRSWCAEGCDEVCYGTPILGGEVEVVAQAPLAGHRWEPVPYCGVVEWLNGSDAYDREEAHGVDESLRPGVHPIEYEWDGDTYLWHYAEPEPEPEYPGHP